MKRLNEVVDRSIQINDRVLAIFEEMRTTESNKELIALVDELRDLLKEGKKLNANLCFFQQTTELLLSENCSGPH